MLDIHQAKETNREDIDICIDTEMGSIDDELVCKACRQAIDFI